jgi:hypothetical protein
MNNTPPKGTTTRQDDDSPLSSSAVGDAAVSGVSFASVTGGDGGGDGGGTGKKSKSSYTYSSSAAAPVAVAAAPGSNSVAGTVRTLASADTADQTMISRATATTTATSPSTNHHGRPNQRLQFPDKLQRLLDDAEKEGNQVRL